MPIMAGPRAPNELQTTATTSVSRTSVRQSTLGIVSLADGSRVPPVHVGCNELLCRALLSDLGSLDCPVPSGRTRTRCTTLQVSALPADARHSGETSALIPHCSRPSLSTRSIRGRAKSCPPINPGARRAWLTDFHVCHPSAGRNLTERRRNRVTDTKAISIFSIRNHKRYNYLVERRAARA